MVVLKVRTVDDWFGKTKGLIGAKTAYPIFFTTRFGIHTFFLAFPIDVLVLDNTRTVALLRENLKPNRFFFWSPLYKNIIELPEGTIKEKKLRIGEKIVFKK